MLRAHSPAREELPKEEVRPHKSVAPQEEAEVSGGASEWSTGRRTVRDTDAACEESHGRS
eukprot:scaffold377_cov269-Pinguiococcus_pyrenoidosus.AAC.2